MESIAAGGTHLVCLHAWHLGDGEPPAWWNNEEGAWMRELEAMRERKCAPRNTAPHSSVN
jgi:hypothetical protein